jgi:hypothetical protein
LMDCLENWSSVVVYCVEFEIGLLEFNWKSDGSHF